MCVCVVCMYVERHIYHISLCVCVCIHIYIYDCKFLYFLAVYKLAKMSGILKT